MDSLGRGRSVAEWILAASFPTSSEIYDQVNMKMRKKNCMAVEFLSITAPLKQMVPDGKIIIAPLA